VRGACTVLRAVAPCGRPAAGRRSGCGSGHDPARSLKLARQRPASCGGRPTGRPGSAARARPTSRAARGPREALQPAHGRRDG
jgi:hypothetical protein